MRKAIFQNHQQAVAQFLYQANESIDIAIYWFSNPHLFSILLKKINDGVRVRLLLQYDQANFHAKGLRFRKILDMHGEVKVYLPDKLLHHKFAITDANKILTGSYNWTRTQHADNVLILNDVNLAKAYQYEFEKLWEQSEPLSLNANTTPPPPGFHKLFQPVVWDAFDLRHAIIRGAKTWLSIFSESEMAIWRQCIQQQRHFLKCKTDFFQTNRGMWELQAFSNWLSIQTTTTRRLLKNYCIKMRHNDVLICSSTNGSLLGAGLVGSEPLPSQTKSHCYSRYVQWFEFDESSEKIENLPKRHFGVFKGSGLRVISLLAQ